MASCGPDSEGTWSLVKLQLLYKLYRKKIVLTSKNLLPGRERYLIMGTRVRSAVSGQFVPKKEAIKHPKTTVTETVKPAKK
jgi:hypothetical protein